MNSSNIFDYIGEVDIVVNPTNIVGVMGKGLAKQFKDRYPLMFDSYVTACEIKVHDIGRNHYWKIPNTRTVICSLATKKHWRDNSELMYVSEGLEDLKRYMETNKLTSVAIPKLGCGLGSLNYKDVEPLIDNILNSTSIKIIKL